MQPGDQLRAGDASIRRSVPPNRRGVGEQRLKIATQQLPMNGWRRFPSTGVDKADNAGAEKIFQRSQKGAQ